MHPILAVREPVLLAILALLLTIEALLLAVGRCMTEHLMGLSAKNSTVSKTFEL